MIKIKAATETQKSLANDEAIKATGNAYIRRLKIFSRKFILLLLCIIIFSVSNKIIINSKYNTY